MDKLEFDIGVSPGDVRTIEELLPTLDMRWIDDIDT